MDTYEKKYKNALTIAQSRFKIEKDESVLTCLGMMFPELRESEDKRIRKAIIELLKEVEEDETYTGRQHIPDMLSYLEKQKEHKPIDYDHEMWKNCVANFEGGKKEVIDHPEKYGLQKEQKPIEKQDYSGLNDLERAILRGFLSAGVENVPVTIIKETAKECLAQMKPVWSEEDERNRDRAIFYTGFYQRNEGTTKGSEECIDWLKSLCPQSKAEWCEEDEKIIDTIVSVLGQYIDYKAVSCTGTGYATPRYSKEIDWLKSLRPQPKQEWGEDDKEMLDAMIDIVSGSFYEPLRPRKEMLAWLKSLRPSWKPSEKQMNCLCAAVDAAIRKHNESVSGYEPARVLKSLYEDLKKL